MNKMLRLSVIILLLMIFVIPQSFMQLKLPFLSLALLGIAIGVFRGNYKISSRAFILYYFLFSLLAVIWCIIGLVNGSPTIAVIESFRVYFVYMWIYFVITIYISNRDYHQHVDKLICVAAVGIGIIALYALADHVYGLGWLDQTLADDMYLQVGVHDGYVQMNNVNIGMLTFIIPYLLGRVILEQSSSRRLLSFGLVIAVVSALLASRRIVLLLLVLAPLVTYVVAVFAGERDKKTRRQVLAFYSILIIITVSSYWLATLTSPALVEGFLGRVLDIFKNDPESDRQLQHRGLIEGFTNQYLVGSGFGGMIDVIRSDERPWTFELTYSRLLFNSGLLGIVLLGSFFTYYVFLGIKKIKSSRHKKVYVPLMVGFVSVLIASASNPYLSSFDFLFALSIIPLILNTRETAVSCAETGGVGV